MPYYFSINQSFHKDNQSDSYSAKKNQKKKNHEYMNMIALIHSLAEFDLLIKFIHSPSLSEGWGLSSALYKSLKISVESMYCEKSVKNEFPIC